MLQDAWGAGPAWASESLHAAQMPAAQAAQSAGWAALEDQRAVALSGGWLPEARGHAAHAALSPEGRRAAPATLRAASSQAGPGRREQAARAAVASVGRPLAPRRWPDFGAPCGLLDREENVLPTSRPGVPELRVGVLDEPPRRSRGQLPSLGPVNGHQSAYRLNLKARSSSRGPVAV